MIVQPVQAVTWGVAHMGDTNGVNCQDVKINLSKKGASEILGPLGLDSHIQALTAGYGYPAEAKSPKILDTPFQK